MWVVVALAILAIASTVTVIAALVFPRLSQRRIALVGGAATPLLLVGRWVYGSWWLKSGNCKDIDVCDSGGWLAMSAGTVLALALSIIIGLPMTFYLSKHIRSK
jgi:hypothetical protein